jgi:hypothetical protein
MSRRWYGVDAEQQQVETELKRERLEKDERGTGGC